MTAIYQQCWVGNTDHPDLKFGEPVGLNGDQAPSVIVVDENNCYCPRKQFDGDDIVVGHDQEVWEELADKLERRAETYAVGNYAMSLDEFESFIAKCLLEFAEDTRKQASDGRRAAREKAKAEKEAEAVKMEEAAAKLDQGALTEMITGVVGGLISGVGSGLSAVGSLAQVRKMANSAKGMRAAATDMTSADQDLDSLRKVRSHVDAEQDLATVDNKIAEKVRLKDAALVQKEAGSKVFEERQARAQAYASGGQAANAIGDTVRSAGHAAETRAEADAKRTDAEGKRDAAEAEWQEQTADRQKDLLEGVKDLIAQIREFLKAQNEAKDERQKIMTRA